MISVVTAIARVEERLEAPLGSFWSVEEVLYALTEAYRVWQGLTAEIIGQVPVVCQVGKAWIKIPKQLVSVSRVSLNGKELAQTSLDELDSFKGAWEGVTGIPKQWAGEGLELMAIAPVPTSNLTLVLEGPLEIQLLKEGDSLEVSPDVFEGILAYAVGYLTFKSGPPEFNTNSVAGLARIAADVNVGLRKTDLFRRWTGLDKTVVGNQESNSEAGAPSLGGRV